MPTSLQPVPGACYKFVVDSAEDAAALIREKLGPAARVLTVRSLPATGLKRFWSGPRLEVIAQIDNMPPVYRELVRMNALRTVGAITAVSRRFGTFPARTAHGADGNH